MTFKKKAIEELKRMEAQDCGVARSVIRECRELVENIPEEDTPCAAPNYEAMYHEAMEKLQKTEFVQESMRNEIQQLHFVNARLVGFKEATELIFRKGSDCHGCS